MTVGAAPRSSAPEAAGVIARALLLLAYPPLAHVASLREEGAWAALAMFSLLLLCLWGPLAQRRPWALAVLLAGIVAAVWAAASPSVWMLLLGPAVVFPALVGWGFARTLRHGRTPLISCFVNALYQRAGREVSPALARYSRRLTWGWALVLWALALVNVALALCAVPDGLLAAFGVQPWWPINHEQWSWYSNLATWGLTGGFAVGEYALRSHLFPDPPYRNALQFLRQMGQVGPAVWRDVMR